MARPETTKRPAMLSSPKAAEIVALVGEDFSKLRPGSDKAMRLKAALIARGAW